MIGTLWEGSDKTIYYVVDLANKQLIGTCAWKAINLTIGMMDHLWLQSNRMRRIDTLEWLLRIEA